MYEYDTGAIVFSFVFAWVIGLLPPVIIRYALVRRPIGKWKAIVVCSIFWIINVFIFTALGSQSKTHGVLFFVAFVSYWILRKGSNLNILPNKKLGNIETVKDENK